MTDDNNKVVKLRQPSAIKQAAGVGVDEAIMPKSFLNMTELEQNRFLEELRERRMRVVRILKEALVAKRHANSVAALMKLEKKQVQVQKALDLVTKQLDKLEALVYDMRALTLQYTDVDITNITESEEKVI